MAVDVAYIKSIIDKALDFPEKDGRGKQAPNVWVPELMVDSSKTSPEDGIVYWKPIVANLDEDDFKKWELQMDFRLSPSYKNFLAYKHFIELDFGHDAKFFRHTPDFMSDYRNHFAKKEWEEIMNEKLVPFANNNERGYFCFDLSDLSEDEFRVVTWEQEFGKQHYPSFVLRYTFIDLLQEMETSLDNRRKTERMCGGL